MSEIFLSASVPLIDRGNYYETASPFLIQCAVRELVISVIRDHKIVWGGHPAITPMIWSICEDLGVEYASSVILYQSKFFEEEFPQENENFQNVVLTESVAGKADASLQLMREEMLSRGDLIAAVFIGGMEGAEIEHDLFSQYHPSAKILTVPSPGGAALELARRSGTFTDMDLRDIDFASIFHSRFLSVI